MQLMNLGFPPIIIQNKSKHSEYYPLFTQYRTTLKSGGFTELFALLLQESLNKRISVLTAKKNNSTFSLGKAKWHQTNRSRQ
jgi:hypothetical protein